MTKQINGLLVRMGRGSLSDELIKASDAYRARFGSSPEVLAFHPGTFSNQLAEDWQKASIAIIDYPVQPLHILVGVFVEGGEDAKTRTPIFKNDTDNPGS